MLSLGISSCKRYLISGSPYIWHMHPHPPWIKVWKSKIISFIKNPEGRGGVSPYRAGPKSPDGLSSSPSLLWYSLRKLSWILSLSWPHLGLLTPVFNSFRSPAVSGYTGPPLSQPPLFLAYWDPYPRQHFTHPEQSLLHPSEEAEMQTDTPVNFLNSSEKPWPSTRRMKGIIVAHRLRVQFSLE